MRQINQHPQGFVSALRGLEESGSDVVSTQLSRVTHKAEIYDHLLWDFTNVTTNKCGGHVTGSKGACPGCVPGALSIIPMACFSSLKTALFHLFISLFLHRKLHFTYFLHLHIYIYVLNVFALALASQYTMHLGEIYKIYSCSIRSNMCCATYLVLDIILMYGMHLFIKSWLSTRI